MLHLVCVPDANARIRDIVKNNNHLVTVWLADCYLGTFPTELIEHCTNITFFFSRGCGFNHLPKNLFVWQNLTQLGLHENGLERWPLTINSKTMRNIHSICVTESKLAWHLCRRVVNHDVSLCARLLDEYVEHYSKPICAALCIFGVAKRKRTMSKDVARLIAFVVVNEFRNDERWLLLDDENKKK